MNRHPNQCLWKLAAGLACALLAGLGPIPAGASTFVYDLPHIAPDVKPQNLPSSPWTRSGFTTDSVSDPSNILTLVNGGGTYGPFYSHALNVSDINSNMNYELRAQVRVISEANSPSFPIQGLFAQDLSDGARYFAWGMKITNSVNRFWIANTSGLPILGLTADVSGSDFFQVDLKRTGPTVTLSVNDNLLLTVNYTDLSVYAPRALDWGNASSVTAGTAEVMGISYGINEDAPLLIPEPSTVMLVGSGTLLVAWRRRRPCCHRAGSSCNV